MPGGKKECTKFCKTVFLKERERVETVVAKEKGLTYVPVDKKKDKELGRILKRSYVEACEKIYCNKGCDGAKKDFVKTVEKDKPRKERLQKNGAISACRDLAKEFPKHYNKKRI